MGFATPNQAPPRRRPTTDATPDAVSVQREMLVELRCIRELLTDALAQRKRVRGPRDGDDHRVLVAVAEAAFGTRFTSVEVLEHSRVAPALKAALADADASSAKSIGRLLARVEDHEIEGWRIERVGLDGHGNIIWRVSRVS